MSWNVVLRSRHTDLARILNFLWRGVGSGGKNVLGNYRFSRSAEYPVRNSRARGHAGPCLFPWPPCGPPRRPGPSLPPPPPSSLGLSCVVDLKIYDSTEMGVFIKLVTFRLPTFLQIVSAMFEMFFSNFLIIPQIIWKLYAYPSTKLQEQFHKKGDVCEIRLMM